LATLSGTLGSTSGTGEAEETTARSKTEEMPWNFIVAVLRVGKFTTKSRKTLMLPFIYKDFNL
jgi:hypothetical protein